MDQLPLLESKPLPCAFCRILTGEVHASKVFEDEISIAFLDHRPLLQGHCLLVPKIHVKELKDLPTEYVGTFFSNVQLLSRSVERALDADGSFIAINIKISQSVPHLHVHIVPRKRKDGLFSKSFTWVRRPYASQEAMDNVRAQIANVIADYSERPS